MTIAARSAVAFLAGLAFAAAMPTAILWMMTSLALMRWTLGW